MIEQPIHPDSITTDQYRSAFSELEPRISDTQRAMLLAHYSAPDRKISARRMAEAVGLANHSAANLHYGRLAALLCERFGRTPESDALFVLVHFIRPHTESNEEWLWQLRAPAAEALEQLGWTQKT